MWVVDKYTLHVFYDSKNVEKELTIKINLSYAISYYK